MPANRFASLVPSEDWDADAFLSALVTHLPSYSWNELANLLSGSLLGVILVDCKFAFDWDAGYYTNPIPIFVIFVFAAVEFLLGLELDPPCLSGG